MGHVLRHHQQQLHRAPARRLWDAWLNGYGTTHTDTVSQAVTLPAGCSTYSLSFWLYVDTAETTTTSAYDTFTVQILNSSGTVLATPATYSNLDHLTGYTPHTVNLATYAGQNITVKVTGAEDYTQQTSFVLDVWTFAVSVSESVVGVTRRVAWECVILG